MLSCHFQTTCFVWIMHIHVCRENLHTDKLAGAERVKEKMDAVKP